MKTDRGSAFSSAVASPAGLGGERDARYWSTEVDAPPTIATLGGALMRIKPQMSLKRCIDQQRFYLFRGSVLHVRQYMRINIECERYAGMSQLLADDFWGDPSN